MFFDFPCSLFSSTTHSSSGSKSIISAGEPTVSEPAFIPRISAGVVDISFISFSSDIIPVLTRAVYEAEKEVSIPILPLGDFSKSAFSSGVCGAWSVEIASRVPSRSPSMIACLSVSVLRGGFILKSASRLRSSFSVKVK